jgi:[acyl-carrier-protein] S-malonyltransferase/trans-AT polyketide synthase/acyltransferase/oxidoreductase domain-containing protein
MDRSSKLALAFPGQGSQKTGMGKDFYESGAAGKSAYDEASDALGFDVAEFCFEEDDRLNLTEYAQPCILATEIAMLRVVDDLYGLRPDRFGGHSLGEYTALVAAGVLPFADALRVVRERGRLMQKATPVGMGGMAAVIAETLDRDEVAALLSDLPVDIANLNSRSQMVISGEKKGLFEAEARLSEHLVARGPFRFVPLTVSAPFHSRFMEAIKAPFRQVLKEIEPKIRPENAPAVTSNFTGGFHEGDTGRIIDRLVSQLSGTVRWIDNMHALAEGPVSVVEMGPGRPLRDFFKSIGVSCTSVTTFAAAGRTFQKSEHILSRKES